MTFAEYWKLLRKNVALLALSAAIGALCGFYVSTRLPQGYQTSQTFFLDAQPQENGSYNYEGYYSQEKSRNFTDTAIALIQSTTYQNAQVTVKKSAPELIKLTVTTKSQFNSADVLSRIPTDFNKKLKTFDSSKNMSLKPATDPENPTFRAPNKSIIVLAGAVIGLIFALAGISLKYVYRL